MTDALTEDPKRREGAKPALPPFHAVIFADWETDDVPGFEAATANEPVWYGERLHEPGDPIVIHGRRIFLSRWPFLHPPCNGVFPSGGRSIHIIRCHFFLNGPSQTGWTP